MAYADFLKSLFYSDRAELNQNEPSDSSSGNLYHRDTGKIVVLQYKKIDDVYENLYINDYSLSTSNNAKPSPMMIGRSNIKSSASNIDQDVFSIGFPKRNLSIGGIATKNSWAWINVIKDALTYTSAQANNIIESGNSILLTSAGITLNSGCNWNLSWDVYKHDEDIPVDFKTQPSTMMTDVSLNPEFPGGGVIYPSVETAQGSANVFPKDRALKWYDCYVKINPATSALKDKIPFFPDSSDTLYFYTSNIDIQWKIDYEPIFSLNFSGISGAKTSPLLNVKRITNTIKLTGYCPTSKINDIFLTNNGTSDLFFEVDAKYASGEDELGIFVKTTGGETRLDKDWISGIPFNLVGKLELKLTPDEPLKVSMDITRIYS